MTDINPSIADSIESTVERVCYEAELLWASYHGSDPVVYGALEELVVRLRAAREQAQYVRAIGLTPRHLAAREVAP